MSEKKIIEERSLQLNRRAFLGKTALGIGGIGLASLLGTPYFNTTKNGVITSATPNAGVKGSLGGLHHPAKIKRVIYLFQSGGTVACRASRTYLYRIHPSTHRNPKHSP